MALAQSVRETAVCGDKVNKASSASMVPVASTAVYQVNTESQLAKQTQLPAKGDSLVMKALADGGYLPAVRAQHSLRSLRPHTAKSTMEKITILTVPLKSNSAKIDQNKSRITRPHSFGTSASIIFRSLGNKSITKTNAKAPTNSLFKVSASRYFEPSITQCSPVALPAKMHVKAQVETSPRNARCRNFCFLVLYSSISRFSTLALKLHHEGVSLQEARALNSRSLY